MIERKVIYSAMSTIASVAGKRLAITDTVAILSFIAQQYCVRVDVLQVLIGRYTKGESTSLQNVYRKMLRWKKEGLVDYKDKFLWLTKPGMKLAGERYEVLPASGDLNHKYVDSQVRLRIEAKYLDLVRLVPGREVLKDNNRKPPGLRDFQICDQIAIFPDERIKVEVELKCKAPTDMQDIIAYYADDDTCNAVWYFTNDETTAFVRRHIDDHPKFHVAHIHSVGIRELKDIRE